MSDSNQIETRILLLRHAETAAPDLFHGAESDVGLGPNGFFQAKRLGERIAKIGVNAVYSSGMRRAEETARVIADACGIKDLKTCPDLHERIMGPLSGMSRAEGWHIYEEAKAQVDGVQHALHAQRRRVVLRDGRAGGAGVL